MRERAKQLKYIISLMYTRFLCGKRLHSAFSNPKYLMRNENRYNLRTNLIVLKKKDKQEKEVEIPLETKKIELSIS